MNSKKYKTRIDREKLEVEHRELTGRELLQLVNKSPQTHRLHQKLQGGKVSCIGPDEIVDVGLPGVERFLTLPLDQTEGDADAPQRDFSLPSEDEEYLNAHALEWATLMERGKRWLIISAWPTPVGYTVRRVTVALFIPPGYADAPLDMAWFNPALVRADGKPIGRTNASETIGSRVFQRWSRHRTQQNPWRPSVDCVSTHLGLVLYWLEREFG